MQINLRKASAIQNEIRKAISAINTRTELSISEFTKDIAEEVNTANAKFMAEVGRKMELTNALFHVRSLVSQANANAGVNNLLAEIERVDSLLKIQTEVASQRVGKSVEELQARIEKIKNTPSEKSLVYDRYNNVETTVVMQKDIDNAKLMVKELKRMKQGMQDSLLSVNVTTTVEVDENYVAILKEEGIL